MSFASLGLSESLVAQLEYETPTPIQAAAIPPVLAGSDVLGAAQTGSGKTAAYALPLLQRIITAEERGSAPRGLILVPTRELANQVGEAVTRYGRGLPGGVRVLVAVGGVGYEKQMTRAAAGVDVLVATPGRLLDLLEQRVVSLDAVALFVMDEADRLLALGFAEELEAVRAALPEARQSLLFSATFPPKVMELADTVLRDAVRIELEEAGKPVGKIVQRAIEVTHTSRTGLLRHLIEKESWDRVLVFVGSKRRADNVALKLSKNGIKATALHGDLPQHARERALEKLRLGRVQALISTDVAARGIDIAGLPCVVNYDLPRGAADYVHRIGRTGRAGAEGLAVSFITEEVDAHFRLIEKRNDISVPRERVEGFEPETWDPAAVAKVTTGGPPVKGKRKSKKDRLREKGAPRSAPAKAAPTASGPWATAKPKDADVPADVAETPPKNSPWGKMPRGDAR